MKTKLSLVLVLGLSLSAITAVAEQYGGGANGSKPTSLGDRAAGNRDAGTTPNFYSNMPGEKTKILETHSIKSEAPAHPNELKGTCALYSNTESQIKIGCPDLSLRLEDPSGKEISTGSMERGKFVFSPPTNQDVFLTAVSDDYVLVPSRLGPVHRGQDIAIKVGKLSKKGEPVAVFHGEQVGVMMKIPEGINQTPAHSSTTGPSVSKEWVPSGETLAKHAKLFHFFSTRSAMVKGLEKFSADYQKRMKKAGCPTLSTERHSAPILVSTGEYTGRSTTETMIRFECSKTKVIGVARVLVGDETNLFVVSYEATKSDKGPDLFALETQVRQAEVVENGMKDLAKKPEK